jgi:hypothetical protein
MATTETRGAEISPEAAVDQPSPRGPAWLRPAWLPPAWRTAILAGGLAWVASRLAYAIVNVLSWRAGHMSPPPTGQVLTAWARWDTGHYLRIAEGGYGQVPLDNAFFPLYPLLIKIFNYVLPAEYLFSGLVVSNLACLAGLVVFYRLTAFELGDTVAQRTVFYLVAFPTAFFLGAAYNASLFLLFAAGTLYAVRQKKWWVAGVLAGLASATRVSGVLLALPFAYEYLRHCDFQWRRIRWDGLWIALVPSGIIAFTIYCWAALGDALAWSHAQTLWYRSLDWPFVALWRTASEALGARYTDGVLGELTIVNLTDFTAGVAVLTLLVLCLVGPWKLRRDQLYLVIYGFAAVLLPMSTPAADTRPLISLSRHVLECLPAFMILGRMGASRVFDRLYVMPAIALQVCFLLIFMHYDWIA